MRIITKEQYNEAKELIHDYEKQEYRKLDFEIGELYTNGLALPAKRDKQTGEVVFQSNPIFNSDWQRVPVYSKKNFKPNKI